MLSQPGVVTHACRPSTRRLRQEDREFEASLELHSETLFRKIMQTFRPSESEPAF
jgi:hypothetical protein